ncbi:acetylornithine deacetylase [Psychromarinibacter sp. S121]|uniref:acetylornithine deacetylase n=1 Tax=Psychromarinibacter sp. S121 TaxID=3415127 RepID=UPI003C7B50F3
MTLLDRTVATLGDLISFPTVSKDTNLDVIGYLARRMEEMGARIEVVHDDSGTKANLVATFGPEGDGGLMLCGHTDVVPVADQPWTQDPFEMWEADGLLYGRGTCDMKGFIACCVEAAPMLAEQVTDRPLHFVFTHDEETGCLGAQALVELLKKRKLRPALAIIGEPTEMRVIEGHKGCYEYHTEFTGLEGHGSAPDRGVNAVEYASRYVGRLLNVADRLKARTPEGSRFDPPWTTINVGVLSGGHAHNVIPARAEVAWEMRPVVLEDADFVKADMDAYVNEVLLPAMKAVSPDAGITTRTIAEVPGLEPMETNAARDLCCTLTGANGTHIVPFGTEAGLFQSLGIDAVVCGPGSIQQAHMADEFISRDQLGQCLDMLTRLGSRL